MYLRSTRWIALLMTFVLCMSLFVLPVMADEGDMAEADDTAPAIVTEESAEDAALVNVIEYESETPPAEEPAAPAPVSDAEETAEPVETAVSEETTEPEESTEPAETADAEEPTAPGETAEPEETAASEEASEEMLETDGDAGPFKISYYNGESLLAEEEVARDSAPVSAPTEADGAAIKAWVDADGKLVTLRELKVTADASYYAWFMPKLKTEEHSRYINGTGSAKFSPTSPLTRAQAATILYQLLDSQKAGPFTCTFSDVSDSAWYAAAVKTLASIGVVNGYTDGSFRPNRSVTRAEFVTMLVNLTGVTGSKSTFTDVSSHWAKTAILAAASQGWINGYAISDGKYEFRPNNNITRAEAVVIMNRVLGRSADARTLATGEGILHYLDVKETDWWYGDVMEASIGHTYTKSGTTETWTRFNIESLGLKAGLQKIGTSYVYIDANGQLTAVKAGINQIAGKYYYAASKGYAIDADLSGTANTAVFANGAASQTLTDGFNRIGNTLFYWQTAKKAPLALTAGLNTIAGKTYWADAAGYVIRNDFGSGVVSLGGKYYLSDGACAIITSGVACAAGKEAAKPTTIDLKDHTVEYNGSMYYLNSDYTVATNVWKGYLYFGSDGKYTSGDSTLDGYVWNIVKSVATNTALTQVQKLLKVYYVLRGGEGSTYKDSGYGYRALHQGYDQGRYCGQKQYSWQILSAKRMFSQKYGECYHWASALLFLARRLGFQAYLVVGYISGSVHCWNMIQWSGKWHISDVEIEWGWMNGWYSGGTKYLYRNLFEQTVSSESISSYTNPECGLVYKFPSTKY